MANQPIICIRNAAFLPFRAPKTSKYAHKGYVQYRDLPWMEGDSRWSRQTDIKWYDLQMYDPAEWPLVNPLKPIKYGKCLKNDRAD